MLELRSLTLADRVDLVRGALDAHLHPVEPSPLPVVATLTAGAAWTVHAIALAAQPAPLDWPGYLMDALPVALFGVALLVPSIVGLWLRVGDADGPFGRLGVVIALAGHVLWLLALVAAALGVEYGAATAVAATFAMVGLALLGLALAGRGAPLLGALVAGAALAGVAPPGLGWPLFGAAWSAIGFRLLLDFRRRVEHPRGPMHA